MRNFWALSGLVMTYNPLYQAWSFLLKLHWVWSILLLYSKTLKQNRHLPTWTLYLERQVEGFLNPTFTMLSTSSPEAGREGSTSIAVQEVDGEAFEGVSVWHRPPHCILKLLVATGNAGAALQLIGRQRRGQQVGQMVVPHCRQLQVLEERGERHRAHTVLSQCYITYLHNTTPDL